MEPENPRAYYEDNQSTIKVGTDERSGGRLKHIDVKHFFVRDEIQRGRIVVRFVPSEKQIADVMTKGLPANVFQQHRVNLGLECTGN